jgi:DDE superfamily endonuclease/Helix-turn-helix of DDE superfamily endonuclease
MIARYTRLRRHPAAFRALTGLTVPQFDGVWQEVAPRLAEAERKRLTRPGRQRQIGAGHPFALDERDRVLLTVVWLRRYPIYEVLGLLFGISQETAVRTVPRVLPVLEAVGLASMRGRDPGKYRRPDLDDLLRETPELAVIVDTFEQRIERPTDPATADTYYSGKKKQHTLKVQVTVDEGGGIIDIAPSVRGPTHDLELLRTSGLPARLGPDVGILGDLAYVGITAFHPTGATPRRKPRSTPRPPEDRAFNTAFASRRVTVEHAIGRLRSFEALAQRDRHHRSLHTARVRAVAGFVNRCLAG